MKKSFWLKFVIAMLIVGFVFPRSTVVHAWDGWVEVPTFCMADGKTSYHVVGHSGWSGFELVPAPGSDPESGTLEPGQTKSGSGHFEWENSSHTYPYEWSATAKECEPVNPPTATVNPPTATVNPPTATVNPPTATVNPPTATVTPALPTYQPPTQFPPTVVPSATATQKPRILTYEPDLHQRVCFDSEKTDMVSFWITSDLPYDTVEFTVGGKVYVWKGQYKDYVWATFSGKFAEVRVHSTNGVWGVASVTVEKLRACAAGPTPTQTPTTMPTSTPTVAPATRNAEPALPFALPTLEVGRGE